jgi:hypothetical protein
VRLPQHGAAVFVDSFYHAGACAEVDVAVVDAKAGEYRSAVGPQTAYVEAFGMEVGGFVGCHAVVFGLYGPCVFWRRLSVEYFIIDVYPLRVDFEYRVAVGAVFHGQSPYHYRADVAHVVRTPVVVVAVDVENYRIVLQQRGIVGVVVEVVFANRVVVY